MYKTIEQIREEYDGQWVFMINCKKNERHSIAGGEVVLHSESRANVFRKMDEADNGTSLTYIAYIGRIPEGVALL